MSRKETMKVYHGIPKSVVDDNTIFYASFDGNLNSSVGEPLFQGSKLPKYLPSPTGYGAICDVGHYPKYMLPSEERVCTIDFILTTSFPAKSSNETLVTLYNKNNDSIKIRNQTDNTFHIDFYVESTKKAYYMWVVQVSKVLSLKGNHTHIRFIIDSTKISIYINGVEQILTNNSIITNEIYSTIIYPITQSINSVECMNEALISDVHISNIDRGDYFPNLPQDLIEGKAIVQERFGQQQIKGDPLYSQITELRVISPKNAQEELLYYDVNNKNNDSYTSVRSLQNPECSVTNAFNWEASSGRVIIKGLNGEIISGVYFIVLKRYCFSTRRSSI